MTGSAIDIGRRELEAWRRGQPTSFWEADPLLRALVQRAGIQHPSLEAFGAAAAGPLDRAVEENNLRRNLPELEDWDGIGRRVGEFAHHPSYHEAGRLIYESGIMAAYAAAPAPSRRILSMFYISCHVGEGGHNCPLACTAGAIRAIQALGTEDQRRRWLPGLTRPRYGEHFAGAQLLTEVQGGSDVGANAVEARLGPDGRWRLHGEKWFCSSADAHVFLVTARPEGAPTGTRGLGLFLLPRLEGGELNGIHFRRLKEKLGTRSMVTAEADLEGAVAEPLGPLERGFPNVMEHVIDTSRLYNAFGCAGLAHRAWLVAESYARHRAAFGAPIANYPLVQETLAFMLSDAEAALAGSFWLAEIQEKVDGGDATPEEQAFLRMGLNLNKVHSAIVAHDAINRGIEILGGNGTIETFSVLPRLLRDNVVFENWEGTHHTLRLQVLRDAERLGLHEGFFEVLGCRLEQGEVEEERRRFMRAVEDGDHISLRVACDRLGALLHLGGLAVIHDPAVAARARLTRFRRLEQQVLPPGYRDLIRSCR